MNVAQLRELLPITQDTVYMNTGWAGPTPTVVQGRIAATLEQEARLGPAASAGLTFVRGVAEQARQATAALVGAQEEEVWITHSTTEGVNIVVHGLPWQPGDELLICDLEHPALTVPAGVLAERLGVKVVNAVVPTLAEQAQVLEIVRRSLTPRTRLVALSHIQFTCGLRMPIKAITEAAHAMDIPVLVDGAQSVGQIEVNVEDLGVDFYAMSGQKWLMGPVGTGALYVRSQRRGSMEPRFTTNRMESERPTERLSMARFSLTSQNPGLVAGFAEAVRIHREIGSRETEARAMELGDLLRERVTSIRGCELLSPRLAESACGLVTVRLDGWEPADLVAALQEEFKVVARAVHNPDGVRFSTAYFNTEGEVDRVGEVLETVAGRGR